MNKKVFGWAIIGSGNIAKTCTKQLSESQNHKVISVYSRNIETATSLANSLGATAYDSLEKAVMAQGVDGVYIATPHSVHAQQAKECINLGKPVLIEKSMCVNAKECQEVFDLAKEKNVYVCEAMWTRFNHVTKQVLSWINSDEIGDVVSLKASFTSPMSRAFSPARVFEKEYAGGALLDVGVYCVAYSQMLLGYPTGIQCKANFIKTQVDGSDKITLKYDNGVVAHLHCAINKFTSVKAIIKGTKGKIVVDFFWSARKAVLHNENGRKVFKSKCSYLPQFDKVANDILTGKLQSEEISHADTMEIVKIMDTCRKNIGLFYNNDK